MSQEVLDTGPEQATVSVVSYPEPNSLDDAAVPNSIQAQAYVDNLTAALNSINMAPSSAGVSAALLQGQPGMTLPAGVSALQAAKAVEDFVANNPSAAMAPGSVTGATLMPAAAPAGPFTPSVAAGAAMQSAQAMNASIPGMLAAAAGTPMVSGCMATMPGAGVTVPSAAAAGMPNLLSAAALQNAQAAAAAAGGPQAVAPPSAAAAAAGLSVTPETPTAAVAGQAGLTAAAPAPPTTSNIAALNANAAAAAAAGGGMPLLTAPQMVPSSVMPNSSAALLASAGLQQATAFVPTGASAAQIAAGMPELQAVQVVIPAAAAAPNSAGSTTSTLSAAATSALQNAVANQQAAAAAAQNAAAVQNALTNQRIALAGLLSNASNSSAMSGLTDNTMTNNNNNNNNMLGFGGLTGSNMTPGLLTGNAFVGSPTAAAAAAGAGGVGGGVPMSMGYGTAPLVGSDSSLHQLKSMSVASSVLSAQPLLDPSSSSASTVAAQVAAMNAAAAAAAGIPASNSGKKVRVLLSSGGVYEELNTSQSGAGSSTTTAATAATGGRSNRWRYIGGETRLVGLFRTNSFSQFLQQLSKATAAVWDENCRLMYDLPGADGDGGTLIDLFDDDDLEMMWEETDSCMAVRPGFRLHIYAQLGSKRGSAEGSTGTIPSADSNLVKDSGSAGHHRISGSTDPAAAAAPGSSSGAAGAGGGDHSSGAQHSSVYTSSEFEDLVEDLVTVSPKVSLADLEARLEIIKPEDLQPIRLLGTGGFGEVYLCHWHSCEVAVKCLNPNLLVPDGGMGSISKDNVSELLKEAALLGSVRHPNIVWVYGLVLPPLDATLEAVRNHLGPGQEIDAVKMTTQMANRLRSDLMPMSQIRPPALVTEYLASGSLRAAITRRADFLSRDSVRIKLALDTARGMDYLHSKSIVHFDLKTANLLVGMRDKTPICKVADFGLSKQKQQTFVTGVATLRGTLPWIAPEIIKTPGTCTEAVDVYSFGVVLWELWTLREPFEGINYHALLHMMSSSTEAVKPAMPGSSEFEGDIPPEPSPGWAELVSDCLATNADDRPSFRDVVGRLEGMLRANRMSKRRASSSPAAGTGTAGLAATGVSN